MVQWILNAEKKVFLRSNKCSQSMHSSKSFYHSYITSKYLNTYFTFDNIFSAYKLQGGVYGFTNIYICVNPPNVIPALPTFW